MIFEVVILLSTIITIFSGIFTCYYCNRLRTVPKLTNSQSATATTSAPTSAISSRHPSQPSVQLPQYHQPTPIRISSPYSTPVLNSHSPATSHTSSILAERMEQMPLPSFYVEPTSPVARHPSRANTHVNISTHMGSGNMSPDLRDMHLSPSRTWPLPQPGAEVELRVPSPAMRERSLSQPPQPYYLEIKSPRIARTKSMTSNSSTTSNYM